MSETAENLVRQFQKIVSVDGGQLTLIAVEGGTVRVGYKPGVDPTCEEGVCVMPHLELQELMGETLSRRAPDLTVKVELVG
jgi:hypothetical protein